MKRLARNAVAGLLFALPLISATTTFSQTQPQAQTTAQPQRTTEDQKMRASISHALESDRTVLSPLIRVDVQDGIATLRGSANTLLAKERALEIARGKSGVTQVVDQIVVEPQAVYVDSELKKHVEQALKKHGELKEFTVDVRDGYVVLNGAAESEQKRAKAGQTVKGVIGVRGLENQIAVRPKPAE